MTRRVPQSQRKGRPVLAVSFTDIFTKNSQTELRGCVVKIRAPYSRDRLEPLIASIAACHSHYFVVMGKEMFVSVGAYRELKGRGYLGGPYTDIVVKDEVAADLIIFPRTLRPTRAAREASRG